MPTAFYPILTPGDLERHRRLSAHARRRSRTRCPTRSTRSRCRIMSSRAPRRPMRRPISTTSSSAASISPPSAIAWNAIRRSRRGGGHGLRRIRSARAAANSPAPGACRSRATSLRSKTAGIGDWTDAEIKTAITQGKRKDGTPLTHAKKSGYSVMVRILTPLSRVDGLSAPVAIASPPIALSYSRARIAGNSLPSREAFRMIRLMLGICCGCDHDERRAGAVVGRARQLSRQHHHDLRQLPFAEGAAGGDRRQGFLRRPALRRAAVQGHRAQHHAGQGNRHRRLDRRADQDDAADRQEPARHAGGRGDADGVLSDPDARRSRRHRRLSAQRSRRSRTRCPIRSTRSRCRTMSSRAPRRPIRRPISTTSSSAASISPPSAIAWNATRRSARRRAAISPNSLGKGGREFPGPVGRVEVAQHHLAARPPASATGPTPRSRRRSPRASARTARRSRAPMGYPVLRQDDGRRSRRRHRLSADRAAEGIGRFPPRRVGRGRGWRASRPSIAVARGLYLGSIDWDLSHHA